MLTAEIIAWSVAPSLAIAAVGCGCNWQIVEVEVRWLQHTLLTGRLMALSGGTSGSLHTDALSPKRSRVVDGVCVRGNSKGVRPQMPVSVPTTNVRGLSRQTKTAVRARNTH